jgi:hypothetical protein
MKFKSIFLVLALFFFIASCKSPNGPDDNGNGSNQVYPPKAGDWTASTTFGTLEFNVNAASTHVTKITLIFNGWKGRSGSVSTSKDPGWSISNRYFKAETNILGDQWTIEGTFENSGNSASGTWKAVIGGQTESGSWQGSPKS